MKPRLIHFLQDGYICEKIAGDKHLDSELRLGKSKLSRQLNELFLRDPERAKELVGDGMTQPAPARWLNISVGNEIEGGWSKPRRAGAPDRNAGTYNAKTSTDGLKSKIR
jgi:hypothetical protein